MMGRSSWFLRKHSKTIYKKSNKIMQKCTKALLRKQLVFKVLTSPILQICFWILSYHCFKQKMQLCQMIKQQDILPCFCYEIPNKKPPRISQFCTCCISQTVLRHSYYSYRGFARICKLLLCALSRQKCQLCCSLWQMFGHAFSSLLP